MSIKVETPEFLIWAIEHACLVRGLLDGSDPERAERQLRAARAVSEARRDGRVFEGLCVDPPLAFRSDDALQVYGGLAAVEAACRDCPANALAAGDAAFLAGCLGYVPLPLDARPLHDAVERASVAHSRQPRRTSPPWYGLWLDGPLEGERLFDTWQILNAAQEDERRRFAALAEFLTGLNSAFNSGARMHVTLFPRGTVENGKWRLVPHCQNCKAEWAAAVSRPCVVCGHEGRPAGEQVRMARGKRPYYPLNRLLGEQQAAAFLVRYATFRAQQQSPDQAQSQPLPAPPDSPPGGSGSAAC